VSKIKTSTAKVYLAPTRGRRYFKLGSAINAEARAMILKKYPIKPFEPDTGFSFHIEHHEPERYLRMYNRLRFIIKKQYEES
jgi:hypothetical protein